MERAKSGTLALLGVLVAVLLLVSGHTRLPAGTVPATDPTTHQPGVYIVQLWDPPVASYRGGLPGLAATNPGARGEIKLDAGSPPSVAYAAYLVDQQENAIRAIEAVLGRAIAVGFTYQHAFNGFSAAMTSAEAARAATLPGVRSIQPEFMRYLTTDVGPQWIGADDIWTGAATGNLPATRGEGVIIGVIDTGLNLDHPSFAEVGPADGYVHINPNGSGNFLGLCLSNPATFVCNDKLIGYYIFTGETTEDTDGHGSHTASTAGGNLLNAGTVDLSPFSYSPPIAGVAPHANIIGYDGCNDSGGCPGSALVAAINQATVDGVDVINYSIGGGTSDPWNDADALAFLAAQDAGIIPVTSAGNSGPGASTVGSPADAPWMVSVGASTHNRAGLNGLSAMSGGATTPPADIAGRGFAGGHGLAPIVYAGNFGDPLCLNPFPASTWTNGEIVVCDRGTIARVAKGFNVLQGGAGGLVLANSSAGQTLNGDVHHLPAVHITFADGVALKTWLASGSGHTATIDGTTLSFAPANGDIMAGFSSRGPLVNTAPDIIKPDVTAPGVDVLAAYRSNPPDASNPTSEYGVVSGTSMSSPHTAGAMALMRALHPGWTASEIKSAVMLTTVTAGVLKEDGSTPADPFDMGAGRVDLSLAGVTGLVMNVPAGDFQAANPANGGDPKRLNLPSLGDANCRGVCSWNRTVSNPLGTPEGWNASLDLPAGVTGVVTPTSFTLTPGASQVVTITIDLSGVSDGSWYFGSLLLQHTAPFTTDGSPISNARMPIAVFALPSSPAALDLSSAGLEITLAPDNAGHRQLTISNAGDLDLDWEISEDVPASTRGGNWSDNFDSYASGSQLHGQGGWKGWGNNPAFGALAVNTVAASAPNSAAIVGASDLVQEYAISSGVWSYRGRIHVPASFSGDSYFILLNQYDDTGASNNWSAQVHFLSAQNQVVADGVGAGSSLPLIRGRWVDFRVDIDLEEDRQTFIYNNQILYSGSWSDGVSGGGITSIGAVDLFANGASVVYYDDLSLADISGLCNTPTDVPWLSVSPTSGTTAGGGSDQVDVDFDATGLSPGTYAAYLCLVTNDVNNRLVRIAVDLTVRHLAYLPVNVRP